MPLLDALRNLFAPSRLDVSARYALLREAISGTMAAFYMARDRETGRIVGLKIIDPGRVAAFHDRFKGVKKPSEGEIAVSLRHPRIVETFEHGLTVKGA
ncbi:MAG: serine/threonine protein kinase, partial [Planctomycetota bacterium]